MILQMQASVTSFADYSVLLKKLVSKCFKILMYMPVCDLSYPELIRTHTDIYKH